MIYNLKKIFSGIVMALFWVNYCDSSCSPDKEALAPQHLKSEALIESLEERKGNFFFPVEASIINQTFENEKWVTTISVSFENNRPGFLFEILDKVCPEKKNNVRRVHGNVLWQEQLKHENKNIYRFTMETDTKEDAEIILKSIKFITDEKNVDYEEMMKQGFYKCIMDIEMRNEEGNLKKITRFLSNNYMNISYFLTPKINKETMLLVLEVEVPKRLKSDELKSKLFNFLQKQEGQISVHLKEGKLIDRLLDDFLLPELDPYLLEVMNNQDSRQLIRKKVRRALAIVSEKHLSQSRNDFTTPYIMHQIEVIKIMVKEFKVFNHETIKELSESLNISLADTVNVLLNSVILHDSVEDGDIKIKKIKNFFNDFVSRIVTKLSKQSQNTTVEDEKQYLRSILEKDGIISELSQLIKIADRLHNLRTLKGTHAAFQRKIFFKTFHYFVTEFLKPLELISQKDSPLKSALQKASKTLTDELFETGKEMGFLDKDGKIIEEQDLLYRKESLLIDRIRKNGGKLNFAEFMKEAMFGKLGFYMKQVTIGKNKSFDTFSENEFVAVCYARQFIEVWEKMGKPEDFKIVEMGAGRGTLAKNIISYIKKHRPDMFGSTTFTIVEISKRLIEEQKKNISSHLGPLEGIPVNWFEGSADKVDSMLSDIKGIFYSVELPDAFPVHRIRIVNNKPMEVVTVFKNGKFRDEVTDLTTKELKEYALNHIKVNLPEGVEIPVNLIMRDWVKSMARSLKTGVSFINDYGGKIEAIAKSHPYGVWNRDIQDINRIYDILFCDITSEVNFYDVAQWAKEAGLITEGYTFQRDFLWNLGIEDIQINGKYLPMTESYDIATNFKFKLIVLTKGLPKLNLTGFKPVKDGFNYFYQRNFYVRVPVKTDESSFLVCTDRYRKIPQEVFKRGAFEVDRFLREETRGYDPFKFHFVVSSVNTKADDENNYVIDVDPSQLKTIKILNDEGKVVFDFDEYFTMYPEKEQEMLMSYKEFEKECSKMLDLSTPESPVLSRFISITKDGRLSGVNEMKIHETFFSPAFINDLGHFKGFKKSA